MEPRRDEQEVMMMAMLPLPSTIHAHIQTHIRLTGPRIRRAKQATQATQISQTPLAAVVRWLALSLSLLPHRLPLLTRFDTFWDTWAVRQQINCARRPKLRRGLAIERRQMCAALRAVRHASARTSWPQTHAAADARWRGEVRDLLERCGVVIEATTDWRGATHFTACDLTAARRGPLTQPSLDALLFDADEPAESVSLTRPHDATTQPALPAIQL